MASVSTALPPVPALLPLLFLDVGVANVGVGVGVDMEHPRAYQPPTNITQRYHQRDYQNKV